MFITENGEVNSFEARARVDLTRTLVTIPYTHDAVHRDVMVNASDYQAAAATEILYFITSPANKEIHLEYSIICGGSVQSLFYEAPDVATAGTAVTLSRLYRPSANAIESTITVGGTVTGSDYGTLLKHQYNGGGGTGSNIRGGSSLHEGAEWVLKVGVPYCLRLIRGSSAALGVEFEWYEVPPYGGRQ
jgi:hypothetical protein